MSYQSFGNWGDACESVADCGDPLGYRCINGACEPWCLPSAGLDEDETSWWCECPDDKKVHCVDPRELSEAEREKGFLERPVPALQCGAAALAGVVTTALITYLIVRP